MTVVLELRCEEDPRTLLGKVRPSLPIVEGNLVELECRACRRRIGRETGVRPRAVLHRFDLMGRLIETEVVGERGSGPST